MVSEHSIDIQVESEQTRLLYKALPASVGANLLAGVLILIAQWSAVEHSILLWWLAIFETIIVLRGILYLKYSVTKNISDYGPWKTAFIVAAVVTGIAWGVAGVIFFPPDNQLHQMVLAFFLLGLSSGAVSSHSFHKVAPYSFVFAALTPLLLRFIYEASDLGYVMAAVLALCIVYLLGSSKRGCETTVENIRLRFYAIEKEHEVEKSRQQAEKATRAKDEFLSSMSHELRTPMNAILGFSQILEMELDEGNKHRGFVKEIKVAGEHLLTLINEILDLSTIEAGKMEVNIQSENLNKIVNESISTVEPLANNQKINIENNALSNSDFYVQIDHLRFKQALLNLLSNAIKYNKPKGSIYIEAESIASGRLRLSVTDTGEGLNEEQQKLLFSPFERINASSTEIEGTGIGLIITKRIIELMGGGIGFKSNVGSGSTFWLDMIVSTPEDISKRKAASNSEPEKKPEHGNAVSGKKILCIEDNVANSRLIQEIINQKMSQECIVATSAVEGISLASGLQPDLILLDITMPEMDGFEALKRLKGDEKTKNIPVIAVSANAMKKDIQHGLEAGFLDYVTKPINVHQFIETVKKYI